MKNMSLSLIIMFKSSAFKAVHEVSYIRNLFAVIISEAVIMSMKCIMTYLDILYMIILKIYI